MFLSDDEIKQLTGIKRGHAKQCEQLKKMHIPFRTNARGEPIVAQAHVIGIAPAKEKSSWHSNLKAA
jgi:hypothetical protein